MNQQNFIGPLERREYLLALISTMVGDKPLLIERPCEPVEFNPSHKIIFVGSKLPKGGFDETKLFERLKKVSFPQVFASKQKNTPAPAGSE